MDSELLNTICKNKSSDIFGLGIILWEISSVNPSFEIKSSSNIAGNIMETHDWIFLKLLKIILKSLSLMQALIETPQLQPFNDTDEIISVRLKKSNKQNEGPEIIPDPPFVDFTTEVNTEKGFLTEQLNVGGCHKDGVGITKDEAESFQWK
ncbi:hypothetical protein Glove_140g63 [Diversispora epigaea]|uniref:Protein kinase domain-containing protein n=1 Tax=Diversispora epigaea TaxID=1348612 RepID=A0A397J3U9_9GLOM|nr:hypothetical protein Glove_140g63 [Diversispora epigaea]